MGKFTRFIVLVPVLFAVTLDASVEAKTCNLKIDGTRDYRDVDDKRISWNAILEVGISEYLVFVYSPYCGHCLEIRML
jgi:hypothetical protein